MKLSSTTLTLLKSFADINPNLLIRSGSKIATRNNGGSVQARAEVEETFPNLVGIYDLPKLLGLISVSPETDISFGENSLTITLANGGEIEYFYTNPELVMTPKEEEHEVTTIYSFDLPSAEMKAMQKTASLISATSIQINTSKAGVILKVYDSKPKQGGASGSSNSYKKNVGESDNDFSISFAIENFRPLIDDNYTVDVGFVLSKTKTKVPVVRFRSSTKKLYYLIAADTGSKVA